MSPSGRHELLAAGCIDISNYITEMPGKVYVTVTLKPAIKKVVSGKIEFELSWVMQEDSSFIFIVSYCNDDLAYEWHLKVNYSIIMLYFRSMNLINKLSK